MDDIVLFEDLQSWISTLAPEIFIGTSLILRQADRFLFGIRPAKKIDSQYFLELTGIGGALEPSDPTLTSGVLREAQEEIGIPVRVQQRSETLVVHGPQQFERMCFNGSERPAAIIFRGFRTPPHQPWHADNLGKSCLVIFQAELEGKPWPAMELPYLVWLQPEQILALSEGDIPIGELQHLGAELITGPLGLPDIDWLARMTDSQEALALALGEKTIEFYSSICTES
jgi:8-oxo-dGTP pyrophosphatase MutT (NUDIX family)